jgi:hypothetical protein
VAARGERKTCRRCGAEAEKEVASGG